MEELNDVQKETLDKVNEQIKDALDKDFIEDVTKNNVCEFTYNDIRYRVAKANYQQKQEIYKERVKKYTQLLKDTEYSLENDLKKLYLSRGIDIDGMDKQINSLSNKKMSLQIKLGEALKKESSDSDCKAIKLEIESIEQEQRQIIMNKQSLLEFSIENQVVLHMYNYMTFIITEKLEGDKWIKAFKTFDEFMKSDDELVTKLAFLITMTTRDML
jgi:hypothetical protein